MKTRWKDLCPEIPRQRLIVEGLYEGAYTKTQLRQFLNDLSKHLKMTIIYGPIVKNVAGSVSPKHKGLECVVIWAESGVNLYTWDSYGFFTIDIYTCKPFSVPKAVAFVEKGLKATKLVYKET